MFLKINKAKGKEYLKIVESYRDDTDGKIKHRVIYNLGNLDKLLKFPHLCERLIDKLSSNGNFVKIDDINKDGNASDYNYGYIILKKIWNIYKLDCFFKKLLDKKEIKNSEEIIKTIFSLVVNRALFCECSKRGYFHKKDYFLYLNEDLKLHNLYRTLEFLEDIKEELEIHLFNLNRGIFSNNVKVSFFDVTTLYFESKKEDELREFGLSKDFKINEVQIVLSLLIDENGIPITFDIYEGSKAETTTLLDALDRLKSKFKISKITIVADRGISRWLNLNEIKMRGYDYIVAVSVKKDDDIKDKLDKDNFNQISFSEENGYYGYKEFIVEKEKTVKIYKGYNEYEESLDRGDKGFIYKKIPLRHKIVLTYSDKRRLKDESDRNRLIEKLQEKLKKNQAVRKSKYLKEKTTNQNNCKISYEIDLSKIEEDKKYDGFYGLASSDASLNALEIIKIHKTIYDIEDAFRDLKHSLNIRPIYHYKKERIKGHIIASFLGYMFLKHIEVRLNNCKKYSEKGITIEQIKEGILSMKLTETTIKEDKYLIKHKHTPIASDIVDMLKIKLPGNIMIEGEMKKYIGNV